MTLPLSWCLIGLFCTNATAFVALWVDKRRAKRSAWRISERTLLGLGLPLAAPGMLMGMRAFSHKTRKTSFLAKAAFVLLLNVVLYGLLTWFWTKGDLRFV